MPQFQLTRWAFIDNHSAEGLGSKSLIARISKQMMRVDDCNCIISGKQHCPIVRQNVIKSPHDLHKFFHYWATKPDSAIRDVADAKTGISKSAMAKELENIVIDDFLEVLARSSAVPNLNSGQQNTSTNGANNNNNNNNNYISSSNSSSKC